MKRKHLVIGLLIAILGVSLVAGYILIGGHIKQISQSKEVSSDTFIEISLEGGGFHGGINPTLENKVILKSNGEVINIHKSLYGGGTENHYFVSRSEVEELANFILTKGFFNMKDVYDCSITDQKCENRKYSYPVPFPIEIHATIGNLNKTVTLTIHDKSMVDYPAELDAIINKIDEMVNNAQKEK